MSRRRQQQTISKSIVSVPAPQPLGSIYLLGRGGESEYVVNAPKRVRYRTYYEMYRQHPTVRAAIEKIAKTATTNGYRFIPSTPGGDKNQSDVDVLTKFFRTSNANQLLRQTYKDLLIYGESFWLIIGAIAGRPQKAMRLHPDHVDPRKYAGQIIGWRYGPVYQAEQAINYALEEVIHFTIDDPASDIEGLSPLESLHHTVASDLFAMKFNSKFFENSASSGLILSMKSTNKEEVERNREWLEQNYVGTENAHRPMILEGDIGVNTSIPKPQEMQFIEGRRFNRQEILSVLDVDPTKIGIAEDANRSVSKEADNSFREETIAPLQSIVEGEINASLILAMMGIDTTVFEQEESSLRDKLANMTYYKEAQGTGVFSVNDILDELGRPHVKDGDVRFVSTSKGVIPLDQIEADAAAQVAGAPGVGVGGPQNAGGPTPPPNPDPTQQQPSGGSQ